MRRRLAFAAAALLLPLLAAAPPERFDRAVEALGRGTRAAVRGDRPGLRAAAAALHAAGALPVGNTADLAVAWSGGAASLPLERDRALGPGYRALLLGRAEATAFAQTFLAGQRARVAVVATAPVGLRVVGEDGATICATARAPARCDWVPAYTARVRIELRNPGAAVARYLLVVE